MEKTILETKTFVFTAPNEHGGPEGVKKAYNQSLEYLGIDYADLYLIHFPKPPKHSNDDKRNTELRHLTWSGLVELYDNGLVNSIGVSNFTVEHLKQLMKANHRVVPTVNQVCLFTFNVLV